MLIYCVGFTPIIFIADNGIIGAKLVMIYSAVMLNILMLIIEKTDHIYWINGVSYDEAEKASYENRMEYAVAHLKTFTKFTVFYLIFTFICHFIGVGIFIESIVFTVGLIAAAVSTIKIKLE